MHLRYLAGVAAAWLCFATASAQSQTPILSDSSATQSSTALDEVTIISASKFPERRANVAQRIGLITRRDIEWQSPQNTAGLLEATGSVFVQRSQLGAGSPNLRGFEASRVLLIVDGVRMNNAIYRAGHLQNVITLDNNELDRVEILYGPASTLYGSDALGGALLFYTKQPQLAPRGLVLDGEQLSSTGSKTVVSGNALARYSSAWEEGTGHVDFNIGGQKFASLTSITASRFGDLRQGSNRSPAYPDFGKRPEYVERVGDRDSIVQNEDENTQAQSGYRQIDLLQKFLYQQSDVVSHTLNLQYSTSSDIPRYDRLTEYRAGRLRYAEWYYGPQERLLASYMLNARSRTGFFNEIQAGVNYQKIEESRHQRNRGADVRQNRIENLNVVGWNVDARHRGARHELTLGTDGQYNQVKSVANAESLSNGETEDLDTRYPDGGATMTYAALYAQYLYKIIPNKLVLNAGVRANYVSLTSQFENKEFFPFPFSEAKQSNIAPSGNLGLVWNPVQRWRVAATGSTGFRAPNVDDIARVFESAGGVSLVVPNPDLKPEYTYNADLSVAYTAGGVLRIEGTGFYTHFRNAIQLAPFALGGDSSVVYNGDLTPVIANQNGARAYLYGAQGSITLRMAPGFTFYSTLSHTFGRYTATNGAEVPLDHVPPTFGRTSLQHTGRVLTGEVFALYNAWKRIQDYNPFGEDNQQYATADGMPAWWTLNARVGANINKYAAVQVALENILDKNYRTFSSGISSAGRNLVVTLRGRF